VSCFEMEVAGLLVTTFAKAEKQSAAEEQAPSA
jgi:hypothetical protein